MVRASVRVTAENEVDAAGFEMLVEDVSDRRTLEQRRMEIGELLGAATTATTLTGQLLAFTRQQPVQPVELDLNQVITDTLSMLKRLAGARRPRVQYGWSGHHLHD